jgi:hypothetical protein
MEQQNAILLDYLTLFIQQQLTHEQIVSMIKKDANFSASNRDTLMNCINSIKTNTKQKQTFKF